MMQNYEVRAFAHTAELNMEKPKSYHDYQGDYRITGQSLSKDGKHVTLKFNPNNDGERSEFGTLHKFGDCESLSDFEYSLNQWAASEELNRNDIDVCRIDFAVNFLKHETADHWCKLSDATTIAFCYTHNVKPKDQYWGHAITTMDEKNLKATWGRYEIERYNKKLQDSRNQAIWRLELRYGIDYSRNHRKAETPAQMLDKLRSEVLKLKSREAFDRMIEGQNACLYHDFVMKYGRNAKTHTMNMYVSENSERIFSTEQLRELYRLFGCQSNLNDVVKNYCKRYDYSDFITYNEYATFIQQIADAITDWVENEARWGDVYCLPA